ncbi:MAG: ExsB family transcriptional regulator [archaeon]
MTIEEITSEELKKRDKVIQFIDAQKRDIAQEVGNKKAINALSGGVDSSTVTMLGHKALGDKLITYFIDNGLMREGEPERVVQTFSDLGVSVELINAQPVFFEALRGIKDPEEKRGAIVNAFYKGIFKTLIEESGAEYLLQGTILTDIDETAAGIKRQHNVFKQIGIDPEKAFGYKILEPLVQLRKDGVKIVAKELGLPESVYNRKPFPGPALAARVIGEVTPEKIKLVRKATSIIEQILDPIKETFQNLAILHEDKVTGIRDGKRDFGYQIEVRSWKSKDARKATPYIPGQAALLELSHRLTTEVPGVVSVTYNITGKPPSTMEAI